MTDYILKMIRRTQYKELSEDKICQTIFQNQEFDDIVDQRYQKKAKKVPRGLKSSAPNGLGWKYHLYDMIGRDLITRVESGGLRGPILRIKKK